MLKSLLMLLTISAPLALSAQWNPDAGAILPYPVTAAHASSNNSNVGGAFDGNFNTNWESSAPMPTGYRSRLDQNLLLNQNGVAVTSSANGLDLQPATDGNTDTPVGMPSSPGVNTWVNFHLNTPQPLLLANAKFAYSDPVVISLYAFTAPGDSILLGTYSSNYTSVRYDFPTLSTPVTDLKIWATGGFAVFEVSVLATLPKESVTLDLGSLRNIGIVETRQWAGDGVSAATTLLGSVDSLNWVVLANLNPSSQAKIATHLPTPMLLRYLKIEHTLPLVDYLRCYVWEMAAFDQYGWQGTIPPPAPSKVNLRQLLGVNSIWHWAYGWDFDSIQAVNPNIGAQEFSAIVSQGRSYHNLVWDVSDPDQNPDFPGISQHGGLNAPWLNWDDEYSTWHNAGLNVQATIQFTGTGDYSFPPAVWDTPYASAYQYGREFALHFGPTYGTGTVAAIEVGNEPWTGYSAEFYREILWGMARGVKEADPAMEVFPCALQASYPQAETEYYKHYMGARISDREAPFLDGINLHLYNFYQDENNIRRSGHPEMPFTQFWEILNGIRFRDTNMPGKKIYVTEWGWDGDGGEECTHSECVSEKAQSVYAVREALLMMRLGVERAHWFFHKNTSPDPWSSIFSRSGLQDYYFQQKNCFHAFEAMNVLLGSRYFINTIQEDSIAYIYQMGDSLGNITHLVAWRPLDADINSSITITVPAPEDQVPIEAWHIEGLSSTGEAAPVPTLSAGQMTMNISTTPLVIQLSAPAAIATPDVGGLALKVYPNPASSVLYIEFPGNGNAEIVNVLGQLVRNVTVQGAAVVDISDLKIGVYWVKMGDRVGSFVKLCD